MMKPQWQLSKNELLAVLYLSLTAGMSLAKFKDGSVEAYYANPPLLLLSFIFFLMSVEYLAVCKGERFLLPPQLQFSQFSINKKITCVSCLVLLITVYVRLVHYFLLGV